MHLLVGIMHWYLYNFLVSLLVFWFSTYNVIWTAHARTQTHCRNECSLVEVWPVSQQSATAKKFMVILWHFCQNCIISTSSKLNENQQTAKQLLQIDRCNNNNNNNGKDSCALDDCCALLAWLPLLLLLMEFVNFELYSWHFAGGNCTTFFPFVYCMRMVCFNMYIMLVFRYWICCQSNFHHDSYHKI